MKPLKMLFRFIGRLLAGVLALAIMIGPVAGVAYAAGNPIPDDLLERLSQRSVDDDTIIKLFSLAFYVMWAWFCAPALRRFASALTRPTTTSVPQRPRQPGLEPAPTPTARAPVPAAMPVAGGPRGLLDRLVRFAVGGLAVTTIIAGPSLASAKSANPQPATAGGPGAATLVEQPAETDIPTTPQPDAEASTVTARHRDTPWSVAMRHFPDNPEQVRDQILELNTGRPLPNGANYRGGNFPEGWQVQIPPTSTPATSDPDSVRSYQAEPGDSPWSISEELTGDGANYPEVLDANVGQQVAPGVTWTAEDTTVHPGYTYTWPADAGAGDGVDGGGYIVGAGDHLWGIATDTLRDELGRDPSRTEIREYTERLVAANRDRLPDPSNPDLLHEGQHLTRPPVQPADGKLPPPNPDSTPAEQAPPPPPDQHQEPEQQRQQEKNERQPNNNAGSGNDQTDNSDQENRTTAGGPHGDQSNPGDTAADADETQALQPQHDAEPVDEPPEDQHATDDGVVDPNTEPAGDISDDETDATSSGPVVPFEGIVGGASVAALIIALAERRRRNRRRVRTHNEPEPPDRDPQLVTAELYTRSIASRSHLETANAAAATVDAAYRDGTLPATALLQGLIINDDGHIEAIFDEPIVPAPTGWTPGASPERCSITGEQLTDPLPEDRLVRSLVSVGRTNDAEIFVDLESLGAIEITGDTDTRTSLLTALVDQLADRPAVRLMTDLPLLSRITGAVTPPEPLPKDLAEQITFEQEELWAELEAGRLESVIDARLREWPHEYALITAVVVADNSHPDIARAAGTGGRGVAVVGATDASTRWEITSDGLHLQHLDVTVTHPACLSDSDQALLAQLLATEPDQPLEPDPTPAPPSPAVGVIEDVDEARPPLVALQDEPQPAAPFEPPTWRAMVHVMCPDPYVTTPDGELVDFVDGSNRSGRRAPELLAYMASARDRMVTEDGIREALWCEEITASLDDTETGKQAVSPKTVTSLIYRARRPLGGDDAISRVSRSPAKWQLADTIITDTDLLTHQLSWARTAASIDAWDTLAHGLNLVQGEPFSQSRSWDWASGAYVYDIVGRIVDAARYAAELAYTAGELDRAIWACDQAMRANPINETIEQLAYDIEAVRGNHDGIRERHRALLSRLATIGEEPTAATLERYQHHMSRSRERASA